MLWEGFACNFGTTNGVPIGLSRLKLLSYMLLSHVKRLRWLIVDIFKTQGDGMFCLEETARLGTKQKNLVFLGWWTLTKNGKFLVSSCDELFEEIGASFPFGRGYVV